MPDEEKIPKKAKDLFEKGMAALERKNYSYAMDMLTAAVDMAPQYLTARSALRAAAINRFLASHSSAMSKQAAHLISTLSGMADLLNAVSALKKKPASAMRIMERLLNRDPLNLTFARLFCRAAEQAGMPDAAIQTLELLREHYPGNTKLLMWLGALYKNANRLQEAKECLEAVAQLKPHDAEASRALKDVLALESMTRGGWGEVAKEGGSFRSAIRDAMEAAVLEHGAKSAPKAESQLEMLLRDAQAKVNAEPENVIYRRNLSNLYLQAERFEDAIYTLQEAKRLSGIADPQIDRLIAAIRLKQFDHDIKMLMENGDKLGAERKTREKQEFRKKDLLEQVERYPNDPHIRFDFGELLFEEGLMDEAIRQLQIAQNSAQHRIKSLYYLGICFKNKGQFDIALEQLEKAAEELPQMNEMKLEVTYAIGETLEAMGRHEEAVERYKEIYRINISYKDVAQKIENAYKRQPEGGAGA